MLTIFSLPKPFKGHINIIQRNAIQSWLKLRPECEIILFGEEEGLEETAREFGVRHVADIPKNKFGTPLLDSAFNITQKIAKNNILVYVNGDIMLMQDLIPAVQMVDRQLFLMSGQRRDLDTKEEINFNDYNWREKFNKEVIKEGGLHSFTAIDYFIFPRELPHGLPPLPVGRLGWDNWFIYHIRSLKIPVIDATQVITAVHQNHKPRYHPKGKESQKSIELAGGLSKMLTLRDADWILTPQGLEKPPFPRRIFPNLSLFYPWRLLLALKRKTQFWF